MAPDQRSVLVRGVNRPNAARPPLVGTINREALLRRLAGPEPVTVRELAQETSLSVPAVSRTLADLVDAGLVVNDGPVVGGLGRRPHGYRIIAALLDPSVVLLGGKLSKRLDEGALAAVRERAWRHCVSSPEVRLAGHGLDAALMGGLACPSPQITSSRPSPQHHPECETRLS